MELIENKKNKVAELKFSEEEIKMIEKVEDFLVTAVCKLSLMEDFNWINTMIIENDNVKNKLHSIMTAVEFLKEKNVLDTELIRAFEKGKK